MNTMHYIHTAECLQGACIGMNCSIVLLI